MLTSSFLAALAIVADGPAEPSSSISVPAVEALTVPAALADLGVQRGRTINGPFTIPAMVPNDTSDDNGMGTFQGRAALPCRDCYITGFSFGIDYPNRTVANVNTGIYMHHAVLINMNRSDSTCPQGMGGNFQRMFGAGNERGYTDLTLNGTRKAGYYVAPQDSVALVAEIMNMQPGAARDVVVTATWDYVVRNSNTTTTTTTDATTTTADATVDFVPAIPVWLDIDGNCGSYTNGSEVAVPANTSVFSYKMPTPWNPTSPNGTHGPSGPNGTHGTNGTRHYNVLVTGSHLHDGGVQLDITKNGTIVCEGVAHYGETPLYISQVPSDGGMPGMPGMNMVSSSSSMTEIAHISSIHLCSGVGTTTSDDLWSVTAHYNMTAHPGLETVNGLVKPIMGIGIIFMVEVEA